MQLQSELKVTVQFLLSFLYDKLPRRRVNLFGEELDKSLRAKISLILAATTGLSLDSTEPTAAAKNQLLYCLIVDRASAESNPLNIDPCLVEASRESALDLKEILDCLPSYLLVTIYRGRVLYKTGGGGGSDPAQAFKTIYQEGLGPLLSPVSPFAASPLKSPFDADSDAFAGLKVDGFSSQLGRGNQDDKDLSSSQSNLKLFLENRSKENDMIYNLFAKQTSNGTNDAAYLENALRNISLGSARHFGRPSTDHLNSPASVFGLLNERSRELQQDLPPTPSSHLFPSPTSPSNLAPASKSGKQSSLFTTAEFAQTKFGSTKIKSYSNANDNFAPAASTGLISAAAAGSSGTSKKFVRPPTYVELSSFAKQKLEASLDKPASSYDLFSPTSSGGADASSPDSDAGSYSSLLTLLTSQPQSQSTRDLAAALANNKLNIENLLSLSNGSSQRSPSDSMMAAKFGTGSSSSSSPSPFSPSSAQSSTVTSPQSPMTSSSQLLFHSGAGGLHLTQQEDMLFSGHRLLKDLINDKEPQQQSSPLDLSKYNHQGIPI